MRIFKDFAIKAFVIGILLLEIQSMEELNQLKTNKIFLLRGESSNLNSLINDISHFPDNVRLRLKVVCTSQNLDIHSTSLDLCSMHDFVGTVASITAKLSKINLLSTKNDSTLEVNFTVQDLKKFLPLFNFDLKIVSLSTIPLQSIDPVNMQISEPSLIKKEIFAIDPEFMTWTINNHKTINIQKTSGLLPNNFELELKDNKIFLKRRSLDAFENFKFEVRVTESWSLVSSETIKVTVTGSSQLNLKSNFYIFAIFLFVVIFVYFLALVFKFTMLDEDKESLVENPCVIKEKFRFSFEALDKVEEIDEISLKPMSNIFATKSEGALNNQAQSNFQQKIKFLLNSNNDSLTSIPQREISLKSFPNLSNIMRPNM